MDFLGVKKYEVVKYNKLGKVFYNSKVYINFGNGDLND